MALEIGPATQQDFLEFAGRLPPYRCQAWSARLDGRVIALGGLAHMPDGSRLAFCDLSDEARRLHKSLHRTGLRFMREVIQSCGARVVAVAHEGTPRAGPWLERLGFVKHGSDGAAVYIHENRTAQQR